jgi:8-amino-7-oxononanoate synthase
MSEVVGWSTLIDTHLSAIRSRGQWRAFRDLDGGSPVTSREGRMVVHFASNDYLGLSQHPDVIAAMQGAARRYGAGAGAARLIVGSRPVHAQLEAALCDWFGAPSALLFPTGFAANLGVLGALAKAGGPNTLICSDQSNHASIIDGARLARAEVAVFRHRDVAHLGEILQAHRRRSTVGPVLVVTDSVFSMDGDVAPLDALIEVTARYGGLLVVDEAHAVFERFRWRPGVVIVATLSKVFGAQGGAVVADKATIDLLRNTARASIFTTALSPPVAAAAVAALGICASAEGDRRRAHLRTLVDLLKPGHQSAIVPVVVGDEQRALAVAASLESAGVVVPAIRPPTVAPGTSRLRVALSASHEAAQVEMLIDLLSALQVEW